MQGMTGKRRVGVRAVMVVGLGLLFGGCGGTEAEQQPQGLEAFTQNETVFDTVSVDAFLAPKLTCPNDKTEPAEAGKCSKKVEYTLIADTGGRAATSKCNMPSETDFPVGLNSVECELRDQATNELLDRCSFKVTVVDNQAPTITWKTTPRIPSVNVDGTCQARVPNVLDHAIIRDNCGTPSVVQAPAAGTWVGVGTTQIQVTVKDNANQPIQDSADFIVRDDSQLCSASCFELNLSGYNLFVLKDYNLGTDVQGKVAAGGNITMNHFIVGVGVPANDIANTLVAGGNLTLSNGGVWGDARYGGSYSAGSTVTFGRGSAARDTPINFVTEETRLRALSTRLAGLPVNGTAKLESWGGLMLRGTNARLNVFQVLGSEFHKVRLLSINAPAGSLVVINVQGISASLVNFGHSFSGGIDQRGVLFNFAEATSITAGGVGIMGTVLAPQADITFSNGSFDGGIYARSMTGNAEGHINPLNHRNLCQ
jgi:choice-of-anchor A domain-containing protein